LLAHIHLRADRRHNTADMASGRAQSSTPVPTTEKADPGVDGAASTVTEPEYQAMSDMLLNIYNYRNDE
jgi:chromatin structure-remodeling complex subunit RSC1/2